MNSTFRGDLEFASDAIHGHTDLVVEVAVSARRVMRESIRDIGRRGDGIEFVQRNRQACGHDLRLDKESTDRLIEVVGQPSALGRCADNLVDKAVQHGGPIWPEVRADAVCMYLDVQNDRPCIVRSSGVIHGASDATTKMKLSITTPGVLLTPPLSTMIRIVLE